MNAACRNANRLAEDAAALLESGRYPSALALAVLAIEEAGKISILRRLAIAMSESEWADAWKEYRSHTSKNAAWMLPAMVQSGARKLEDFRPLFQRDAEHPYLLDMLKQVSLYTDCLGRAHWSVPEEVVDEALARTIVSIARVLAGSPNHTEKEVALWVEHMAPAFASEDYDYMKQALLRWQSAMQASGLSSSQDNMEAFLGEGLQINWDHRHPDPPQPKVPHSRSTPH